jgi:hypothetical protein
MGDHSELDTDAFLMKGECVRAGAWWRGNPAIEAHASTSRELALLSSPSTETG